MDNVLQSQARRENRPNPGENTPWGRHGARLFSLRATRATHLPQLTLVLVFLMSCVILAACSITTELGQ